MAHGETAPESSDRSFTWSVGRRDALLRLWGTGVVVVFAIAAFVPIHTAFGEPAHSMISDNRTTDLMVAIVIGLPLIGLLGFRDDAWRGLALGAVVTTSTWALCAVAVTILEIRVPATSGDPLLMEGGSEGLHDPLLAGDPAPYLGFYLMVVACMAGVGFVIACVVTAPRPRREQSIIGRRQFVLGVAASVALIVSLMLPPHSDAPGFLERNFRTGYLPVTLAWLVFVCALGGAAAFGFAERGRMGLGVVVASVIPAAWLAAIDALGLDTPIEPGPTLLKSAQVHPLFHVALVGQVVAVAPAVVRYGRSWRVATP